MGCCGGEREKAVSIEQKWDYISFSDFRSTSCLTPFSYIWLWFLAFISVAVYVTDTFVAVNLLAFNRWSSQIQPSIKFEISKWIFSVCIILSFVFAVYEWQRAIRVIRRGSVAEAYLDELAVVLQSMGIWQGKGWKRFLVFAELTKSRKGVDYVALFVYFQFKGALRIILAEGPRQAVNAITLYSVMKADMLPVGEHESQDRNNFDQFWYNVQALANQNKKQIVILSGMLFSLTIWVIFALLLLIACVLYLVFLWHYIPSADGNLRAYCRRKADQRLELIVGKKVRKALEKEQAKARAQDRKAMKQGKPMLTTQPTLPSVDEKVPTVGLTRMDSAATSTTSLNDGLSRTTTLTSTTSKPQGLPGISEVPVRPGMPSRNLTTGSTYSNASYGSNAPLLDNASSVGFSDPVPRMPAAYGTPSPTGSQGPMMNRTMSGSTMTSSMDRPGTANSQRYQPSGMAGPPSRGTPGSYTPGPYPPGANRPYPPNRPGTAGSYRQGQSPISPYDQRSAYPPPAQTGPSYEMSPVGAVAPRQMPDPRARPSPPRGESIYDIDDYFSDPNAQPPPAMPAPLNWQRTQGQVPYPSNTSSPGSNLSGPGYPAGGQGRRDYSSPLPMPSPNGPGGRPPQMRSATTPYTGAPQAGMNMPPRSATAPLRGPMGGVAPPPMPQGGPRSQSARPYDGQSGGAF